VPLRRESALATIASTAILALLVTLLVLPGLVVGLLVAL
jgi:hypothetical protein